MKTIFLIPTSPPAAQGAATSLSPTQTTHIIRGTPAPRLVKAARSLPAQARKRPAGDFPAIPVDRSHSTLIFALMLFAAAIAIYFSALAIVDFVAR